MPTAFRVIVAGQPESSVIVKEGEDTVLVLSIDDAQHVARLLNTAVNLLHQLRAAEKDVADLRADLARVEDFVAAAAEQRAQS